MLKFEQQVTRFWYPADRYRGTRQLIYRLIKPLNRWSTRYALYKMTQRQLLPLVSLPSPAAPAELPQQRPSTSSQSPLIVVVGNITVGGTGKTPVIIGLVEWLQQQGYQPGIISRGYGAHTPWCASLVSKAVPNRSKSVALDDCAAEVGDEPLLLRRRTQVPVVVNPRRCEAVAALRAQCPDVNVILCDDGLQHYGLPRHIEIAVVDGQRGFGNGCCLPVGPLREPIERLASVNAVLVHAPQGAEIPSKLRNQLPSGVPQATFHLQAGGFYRVLDDEPVLMPTTLVSAVTGIGHPKRFFDQLSALGLTLNHCLAFPDHHHYKQEDFAGIERCVPVVMTEKDSVKCRAFAKSNWYYLKVETQLDQAFLSYFQGLLSKAEGNTDSRADSRTESGVEVKS